MDWKLCPSKKFIYLHEFEVAQWILSFTFRWTVNFLLIPCSPFLALELVVVHFVEVQVFLGLLLGLVIGKRITHYGSQNIFGLGGLWLFGLSVGLLVEHGFFWYERSGSAPEERLDRDVPIVLCEDFVQFHLFHGHSHLWIFHKYFV